ncbi:hypothetical protein [Microbacterium sp.]|uniref:hypothetical protein n=1 Tax=Microbacterium sp. TaxID=51671 RepID=UPI0027373F01|nr:hypothetical protein [Microbacterium sp.]MDP3953162.1 hypothetical protein [Microbacterium sp.]
MLSWNRHNCNDAFGGVELAKPGVVLEYRDPLSRLDARELGLAKSVGAHPLCDRQPSQESHHWLIIPEHLNLGGIAVLEFKPRSRHRSPGLAWQFERRAIEQPDVQGQQASGTAVVIDDE